MRRPGREQSLVQAMRRYQSAVGYLLGVNGRCAAMPKLRPSDLSQKLDAVFWVRSGVKKIGDPCRERGSPSNPLAESLHQR